MHKLKTLPEELIAIFKRKGNPYVVHEIIRLKKIEKTHYNHQLTPLNFKQPTLKIYTFQN